MIDIYTDKTLDRLKKIKILARLSYIRKIDKIKIEKKPPLDYSAFHLYTCTICGNEYNIKECDKGHKLTNICNNKECRKIYLSHLKKVRDETFFRIDKLIKNRSKYNYIFIHLNGVLNKFKEIHENSFQLDQSKIKILLNNLDVKISRIIITDNMALNYRADIFKQFLNAGFPTEIIIGFLKYYTDDRIYNIERFLIDSKYKPKNFAILDPYIISKKSRVVSVNYSKGLLSGNMKSLNMLLKN